jgi:probable addiction module antidote protein
VDKAHGITQLAKDSGLGRESLYKALTPGAKPRYDTILKLLQALGVKLQASPNHVEVKAPKQRSLTKKKQAS